MWGNRTLAALVGLGAIVGTAAQSAADVNVSINLGTPPPPPIVIAEPPPMIVVPQAPQVYYAPSVAYDFFYYGGRYYTFHEGHWFMGPKHNGPWTFVSVDHVPAPVVAVPARYYRVAPAPVGGPPHCPPGQAKKGRC
jgi:YXWGXW repeat-containing protein